MFTKIFWKRAAERALKSFGQGIVLAIGSDLTALLDLSDWKAKLVIPVGMALLSVGTSMATAKISGDPQDPSMVQ